MCVAKRVEDSCKDWTYERDWDCWYNDIKGADIGKGIQFGHPNDIFGEDFRSYL